MRRLFTWNMQGGAYSGESKWTDFIHRLMYGCENMRIPPHDVGCLQECGTPPETAIPWDQSDGIEIYRLAQRNDIEIYRWDQSRTGEWLYIYYGHWGQRCNTAVITRNLIADDFASIAPEGPIDWRNAIGVRIPGLLRSADRWYVSFHAISPHGPDSPAMLTAIAQRANGPSVAAGDWNRQPDTWAPPPGYAFFTPNTPTRGNHQLDYAVSNVWGECNALYSGWSDHLVVSYTFA